MDHLEAEGHRLVPGLDDEGIAHLGDGGVRRLQHGEVGRRQTVLPEDHLGDDLVERQRVRQRPRGHVGYADHLQDAGHMGVARLALDAVRDVEDQTGTFALDDPRHELLEPVDQVLVALQGDHLVPVAFRARTSRSIVFRPIVSRFGRPNRLMTLALIPVVDDGDFHSSLSRPVLGRSVSCR